MNIAIVATKGNSLLGFRGKLISEWVKRGHNVTCVSIEKPEEIEADIKQLGASYYQVSGSRTGTSFVEGFKMISLYKKAFNTIKPDICFLYMSKPIAYGGVAARKCNIPNVYVFVTGLEIAFYNKGFKNWVVRKVLIYFFKRAHAYSKKVFFMNRDDYNYFKKLNIIESSKSRFVNGSGVDLSYYFPCSIPPKNKVCMVGRLVWSKGIQEYIDAARIVREKYPDIEFLLVGGQDNNPESLSKQEIEKIKKDNIITLCGYQSDVRQFIQQCSIFVLPSYHEGNGRSIVEAEAMGRPIITTDAPGCRDTVKDGFNGFIVPVKNGEKIAEMILFLIEHPSEIKRMGLNSIEYAKKFDVNTVNEIFLKEMNVY